MHAPAYSALNMNMNPNHNAYQADFYFLGDMPFMAPPPQAYYAKPAPPPPPPPQHMPPLQPQRIEPHDNDVLMGRGGKNNQHTGNENLRDMARAVREEYRKSAKKGKSNMSRDLVQKIRSLDPPGRFLKRNPVTNEWEDVGDEVAREKVSQVLRDAVSEYCGPKAEKAAGTAGSASGSVASSDENKQEENQQDDQSDDEANNATTKQSEEEDNDDVKPKATQSPNLTPKIASPKEAQQVMKEDTPMDGSAPEPLPVPVSVPEAVLAPVTPETDQQSAPDSIEAEPQRDDTFEPLPINTNNAEEAADATVNADESNLVNHQPKMKRRSWNVPVASVPWRRNRAQNRGNKTNFLEKYSSMNMGTSEGSMSIGSFTVNSTSSRQLSTRQLSTRQLSTRQLSSRQLSGRQLTMERRKQNFAEKYAASGMGESDLSLDSLSISGHSTSRNRSRKNIFMDQYTNMDMGLSDSNFSLSSARSRCDSGFSMADGAAAPSGHGNRPSVIVEGDLESDLENSNSNMRFSDVYQATGMGQSESNFTMNTIGTFSGHSRMTRGGLLSLASGPSMRSMRMESGHSFLTIDELELDMLDDEFFDDCDMDDADDYDVDEFSSEFC